LTKIVNLEKERALQRQMEELDIIKYTPGRFIPGKGYIQAYDDRFILQMAADEKGIVVSNDQFRDLSSEKDDFRETVNNRLLP
jgi:ribonuclease ZC3H12